MILNRKKQDLDHQLWKLIKLHSLEDKKILVALSGGVDSLSLLVSLSKVHKRHLLAACYYHHGGDSNKEYRDQAALFCSKICQRLNVEYFILENKSKTGAAVKSEDHYRKLRYAALRQAMTEKDFAVLATGHHLDDLLETRLMRLIRGTGAQGLEAMKTLKDEIFRPFLEVPKKSLQNYLKLEKVRALKDPSNKSQDPFRNWIREKWLRDLEKRQNGGLTSLARSLSTLAEELGPSSACDLLHENVDYKTQGLQRSFYLTLGAADQRRLLAQYLYALNKRDYSQSQLEEIQKRLDKSQKVLTFKVSGCVWEVNAQQISVQS